MPRLGKEENAEKGKRYGRGCCTSMTSDEFDHGIFYSILGIVYSSVGQSFSYLVSFVQLFKVFSHTNVVKTDFNISG